MSAATDITPQPMTYQVELSDISLQVTEWPGSGDPILLLHATGFHSRCWDTIARQLKGAHVYAVDLRFHGGSDRHGQVNWLLMARDIEELLQALDLKRVVGVGHSLGGYLAAYVGAKQQERFKHLVLIDPVIFQPQHYLENVAPLDAIDPANNPVSRRKNVWRDEEEMYLRFKHRAPFDRWQDQVLRDYCNYALRTVPQESALQLACNPLHEASIYMHHKGNEAIYDLLPTLKLPVTVLRAPQDLENPGNLSGSPTWPGLAKFLPNACELYLPELSHFIPMEDPALVARIIREAVEQS
jgi:pimeloyl-ACP methyl ester carboxylesterase